MKRKHDAEYHLILYPKIRREYYYAVFIPTQTHDAINFIRWILLHPSFMQSFKKHIHHLSFMLQ